MKNFITLFLFLSFAPLVNAQIFTANPANSNVGNPDAVVAVTGLISSGIFLATTPEACVQGDDINGNGYGEDPEWRFDIAIPTGSGPVAPSCKEIEFRVCRRGDFGQSSEGVFVYDEAFNQIGLIPGHPSNSTAFDCTNEPICTIITLDPCAFNEQTADGIWSVTLYTNGAMSGNTVGDFCDIIPGPQPDGDAASCVGDCPTYTQAVGGVFNNQANSGPMVNTNCVGCNCAFIDYLKMEVAVADTSFAMSADEIAAGMPVTLTPGFTNCEQNWTVNGGTAGLANTSGTTTFTSAVNGTFTVCNTVGIGSLNCLGSNCKTLTYRDFEDCTNGVDDNGNGLIDCGDPDCLPGGGTIFRN